MTIYLFSRLSPSVNFEIIYVKAPLSTLRMQDTAWHRTGLHTACRTSARNNDWLIQQLKAHALDPERAKFESLFYHTARTLAMRLNILAPVFWYVRFVCSITVSHCCKQTITRIINKWICVLSSTHILIELNDSRYYLNDLCTEGGTYSQRHRVICSRRL